MLVAGRALTRPLSGASTRQVRSGLSEFLLTGGGTLVLLPLLIGLERALGLDAAELAVGFVAFHAASVVNDPHFTATYLLFYRDARRRALGDAFAPAQRLRYLVAGVVVPIALAVWIAVALVRHSASTLGLLIQLMFLLVGWHYVKQGFGVLTILSSKRGVRFSPRERAALLFHCYAGWAYAWASPATPAAEASEKGVLYTSIAHPVWLQDATRLVFFASAALLVATLWSKARREGRLPPLAPLSGFLATIWVWTVYSSENALMIYIIPALHSLQYLYFVWLLERGRARAEERAPLFGRPVAQRLAMVALPALALGWIVFRGAPPFFDETLVLNDPEGFSRLGPTPYFAAIFAFVNLHHYFMDAVLWRRDNPETRHLTFRNDRAAD
jgi:hypothetical protein